MKEPLKIGISHGDTNGVGYEILLKTFGDERLLELFTPVIYGSSKTASYHRKVLDYQPINFNIIQNINDANHDRINLINSVKEDIKIEIGQSSSDAGKAAFMALEHATRDLKEGKIDALVTLPINKDNIQSETFSFAGHTEYLQDSMGENAKALMILVSDKIRIALATTHIPLAKVPSKLSLSLIIGKLEELDRSLKRDFNIQNPRIAVLALNPHAGENGLLGDEEQNIIGPAIKKAQDKGILCAGAFPADGFFGSGRYREFDAVLAMYHDQGLIPFKTIAMDSGVNFTAGLPIVRTSPDHGTAYDIAGKGIASEESFRQAIYTAIDIFNCRKAYDEALANPLPKMFFDRGKDDVKLDLTKEENEV